MVKRGLGRGLGSLIPSFSTDQSALEEIPIHDIAANPGQPRQRFDPGSFSELVASIRRHGIVQPVVVRPRESGYELVAGERRWRAAKEAGLAVIPAIIKQSDDSEALQIALIENIQREDLNAVEEATAYKRLADEYGFTQAELAEIVGKNRATVANTLRLLNLSDEVKQMIVEHSLSSGHARALLVLDDQNDRNKLAQRVVSEGLSVRQTEELAKLWQLAKGTTARSTKLPLSPEMKTAARRIGRALGVKIKTRLVRDKIKLELELRTTEDLHRLEQTILSGLEVRPRS